MSDVLDQTLEVGGVAFDDAPDRPRRARAGQGLAPLAPARALGDRDRRRRAGDRFVAARQLRVPRRSVVLVGRPSDHVAPSARDAAVRELLLVLFGKSRLVSRRRVAGRQRRGARRRAQHESGLDGDRDAVRLRGSPSGCSRCTTPCRRRPRSHFPLRSCSSGISQTMDAMCVGLLALATYASVRAASAPRVWWALAVGALVVMSVLTKYAAALFVPTVLAVLVLESSRRRGSWAAIRKVIAASVAGTGFLVIGDRVVRHGDRGRSAIDDDRTARCSCPPRRGI